MQSADLVASTLAGFVAALQSAQIPAEVSTRARHLLLDAIGCGLAARREPFAQGFQSSLRALAGGAQGTSGVVGHAERMLLRDAVMFNGMLMHGLDFDDTHMAGVVHLTVSVLPAVLNLAAQRRLSGSAMLTAYIAAVEAGARIASAVRGGFHQQGFHPTGVVGTFASALAAGKLMGLDAAALVRAQGAALSMASGSLQFIEDGAWTKRLHAGWAAQAGLTAASFAAHGIVAPQAPYTGRYGLYRSYLGEPERLDLSIATRGLDAQGHASVWELMHIAVKPFAMCHFVHAATDAAIALHGLDLAEVELVEVLVPQAAVELVCEPAERKRRPQNEYDAKFSLPYAVASGLMRGRLGLKELQPEAYLHADACALMDKVQYRVDPDATFPRHYSGEVRVRLRNGTQRVHREAVNRGHPERPVSNIDVVAKFMDNAGLHFSASQAQAICSAVLELDQAESVAGLEAVLAQDPQA
ncbi:MmgE/PrpD family protein [Rhodoferax sp.]|uniref:MmgE/PrpD family protein n=1 Tax=Rhodoferax sp. TaxID=50421 RepID=UPI00374D340F